MTSGGVEGERKKRVEVPCQTAAVAGGWGLLAVTHCGTPCCSHAVGEGPPVQQLRGEDRWKGVCVCVCVSVCESKTKPQM